MRDRTKIYSFEQYRDFLNWAHQDLKKREPSLSQRNFARLAGLKSPSHFQMILAGKRRVGPETARGLAEAFELTDDETQYFLALVNWNQAKNESERRAFASEILKCRGFKKHRPLAEAQYRYFRNWYYVTIFELMGLKTWTGNPSQINELLRTPLLPEQIEAALIDLKALGLVEKKQSKWHRLEEAIVTPDLVVSDVLAHFHLGQLKLSQNAINDIEPNEREVISMTFSANENSYEEFRDMVRNFVQETFSKSLAEKNPTQVLQLNVQLFPHTKRK